MQHILFVCTGNTCRSFMAQAVAEHLIAERSLESDFEVASAGVAAMPGGPASDNAVEALMREGIAVPDHRSQPLTPALCAWADVVVAMTPRHRDVIVRVCPDANVVVPDPPVDDPFGGDVDDYRRSLRRLRAVVEELLP